MAILSSIGEFVTNLGLEVLKVQEPWWLLLAVIPLILLFVHLAQRQSVADLHWKNETVRDASVIVNRNWPRHWIAAIMLTLMALAVYPAARPINSTTEVQEKALLIWVYDASESMTTVDVVKNDALVSRLDASVAALEESLVTIPADFYKLLVSFAGPDEVEVGLPTLNSNQLLDQANNIPRGERTATDFGLERAVSACEQFFNNTDDYPCEIFLLSDGECNPRPNCYIRSKDIAAEAASKGMVIHAISWGNPESDYRPNPDDMQALADIGNGRHLLSVQTSELAELYNSVATSLDVQTTHQALASGFVWIARGFVIALAVLFLLRRWE